MEPPAGRVEAMSTVVTRPSLVKKARLVEEVAELIKKYPVVAVFDLRSTRANTIHEMRKKLRGLCEIRVLKRTLFVKACRLAGKPELEKLVENIKVPVGFIFSSVNSFQLALTLEKNKVPMHAKAGEKADFDIWVPETNTGLPPGPILSDFGKLRIPTRIEGGQVWIAKDTLVAKKGEEISQLLASLLVKLDIKAVLRGVNLISAYEEGVILKAEDLVIDPVKIGQEIASAASLALAFAVNISYITRETLPQLLIRAETHAKALATEAGFYTRETLPTIFAKALAESNALARAAGVSE
ncbi:MAG: 50S ribosomal protein L10 [Candidatus Caldarchaeum sp.]|uniref:Large ribosomal subunit protein uL10 n=2 Tax=Caldiarchaeum subterraneum TaxID=311458 RepID=A0A7J3WB21_CALS0